MEMPLASSIRKSLFILSSLALAQTAPPYHERYRPQFHFSPFDNWANDPNGLVFFNGTYHLFFQFNPIGTGGHKNWGHATSVDLVHWKQQPVAIPEENGIQIYTGSAVVDRSNSSGFCTGRGGCMVAIYTGHTSRTETTPALETQNLAYSNDAGQTWTKYSGNPVIDVHEANFRDPKVFWFGPSKQWIMAVSLPNDHKVRFYGSKNLKKWAQLSEFGPEGAAEGQWECPEIFELPLDGKTSHKTKWVLKVGLNPGGIQGGSGEQYFIGRFDGKSFINDNPPSTTLWTDYGKDCYCALTFNNLPAVQPQTMLGWMSNWQYAAAVPTSPWRGQMTIPRVLSLKTYPEGVRLVQEPTEQLKQLRGRHATFGNMKGAEGQTYELVTTMAVGQATDVGWKLLSEGGTFTTVGYNVNDKQVYVDRTHSGDVSFSDKFPVRVAAPFEAGERVRLHIFVDQSSVEVFVGDGQVTLTNLVYPPKTATQIEFYSVGGDPGRVGADFFSLKSIW